MLTDRNTIAKDNRRFILCKGIPFYGIGTPDIGNPVEILDLAESEWIGERAIRGNNLISSLSFIDYFHVTHCHLSNHIFDLKTM